MPEPQLTCFVIMGYDKKTDFETGRVLDLNQSYVNLIKPAVEAAGLKCQRADEIVHSGLIDVPMYERLLNADVVVADLSTSNRNAIYELGIRHALRPYTTVVIAEDGLMKSPFFDLNHILIRKYRHLGEDIGASEVRRFTAELTAAIKTILAMTADLRHDSPVYKYIDRLTPPSVAEGAQAVAAARGAAPARPVAEATPPAPADDPPHRAMIERVNAAQNAGDFLKAKFLLEEIRDRCRARSLDRAANPTGQPTEDPSILQRLALVTYKSKSPTELASLHAARDLLALLDPRNSNDTETLGLWGAVHKRLWKLTTAHGDLDEAVRAYERGFSTARDYYNGINFAYLLNLRAATVTDPAEAIADYVLARRVRKEVTAICEAWLAANPPPDAGAPATEQAKSLADRYWVLATLEEAAVGVGDGAQVQRWHDDAALTRPAGWMLDTTRDQINALVALLDPSPLLKIQDNWPSARG